MLHGQGARGVRKSRISWGFRALMVVFEVRDDFTQPPPARADSGGMTCFAPWPIVEEGR